MRRVRCARAGLVLACILAGAAAHAATVDVEVRNVRDARGRVHVELCPEALWLGDCTIIGDAPAVPGTTIVRVSNVPPGLYAAQAYHDANDNHKVDRGFLGVPREGVGFSNDAKIYRRGPRFEDARFHVGHGTEHIALTLKHFF